MTTDVPCAGCTVCCRDQLILLMPEDSARLPFLNFVEATDKKGIVHRALNEKPDGTCAHLGPGGCEVYEHRPEVCRAYDCRKQFLIMTRNDRRQFKNQEIWKAARKRLVTLDADDKADVAAYANRASDGAKKVGLI